MTARSISSFPALASTADGIKILVTYNGQTHLLSLSEIKALITKEKIGLGNVDNTSDLDKPLSTAAIAALADKADGSHTHLTSDIDGLDTAISDILARLDNYDGSIQEITAIQTALVDLQNQLNNHQHNISDVDGLDIVVNNYNQMSVDLTALTNAVSTLLTSVTAIQTTVNQIQGSLTNVENEIADDVDTAAVEW